MDKFIFTGKTEHGDEIEFSFDDIVKVFKDDNVIYVKTSFGGIHVLNGETVNLKSEDAKLDKLFEFALENSAARREVSDELDI